MILNPVWKSEPMLEMTSPGLLTEPRLKKLLLLNGASVVVVVPKTTF